MFNKNEILNCCECNVEGTWDGGSNNGNLFHCEDQSGCNNIICYDCLVEKGLYNDDIILCPECYNNSKAIDVMTFNHKALENEEWIRTDDNQFIKRIDNKYEYKEVVYIDHLEKYFGKSFLIEIEREIIKDIKEELKAFGYTLEEISKDPVLLVEAIGENDDTLFELNATTLEDAISEIFH